MSLSQAVLNFDVIGLIGRHLLADYFNIEFVTVPEYLPVSAYDPVAVLLPIAGGRVEGIEGLQEGDRLDQRGNLWSGGEPRSR